MFPAAPDRSDGMNYEARGQTISASQSRVAGLTTAERSTFGAQFETGSAMNRAIHSAAAEKCRVCRVHNRIDFKLRDVAADNLDFGGRAQSVSDRGSRRSRRQSSVYFFGHRFILYDRTIAVPLAAHRLRRGIGKHPTERERNVPVFQ